jgi:hypothetical protein
MFVYTAANSVFVHRSFTPLPTGYSVMEMHPDGSIPDRWNDEARPPWEQDHPNGMAKKGMGKADDDPALHG